MVISLSNQSAFVNDAACAGRGSAHSRATYIEHALLLRAERRPVAPPGDGAFLLAASLIKEQEAARHVELFDEEVDHVDRARDCEHGDEANQAVDSRFSLQRLALALASVLRHALALYPFSK
jgi:hypothetical protein